VGQCTSARHDTHFPPVRRLSVGDLYAGAPSAGGADDRLRRRRGRLARILTSAPAFHAMQRRGSGARILVAPNKRGPRLMGDRFRDLAALYGGTTAWLAEQQRLDRLAFSGADLVERVSRNALAGGWKEFLRPDPADYLGIRGQLFASERVVAEMERAELASLGDRDLAAHFGGN